MERSDQDASIRIAGTIDVSKGYVYVTESGNINEMVVAEDGATIILNKSGDKTQTYQMTQTAEDEIYVSIGFTKFVIKNF